jgi:hypothetical protein
VKKQSTDGKVLPTFKVDLEGTDWILVITNEGSHFFHNTTTKESHWVVENKLLANAMSMVDRDTLILLVAKARGLRLPEMCDSKIRQLLSTGRRIEIKDIEPPAFQAVEDEPQKDEDQDLRTSTDLVGGYSSSDDSDDGGGEVELGQGQTTENPVIQVESEDRELHEDIYEEEERSLVVDDATAFDQLDSSGDENGLNVADLDSSDAEEVSPEKAKVSFIQLLDDAQLDPFKPWEVESLRIINDPRLYLVDDNKTRKKLYNEWSVGRLRNKVQPNPVSREDPFVAFMRYLESKTLEGLFSDFKKKWDNELGAFDLSEREKEKTYREFVIFMKKPQSDREKIFRSFITNAKVFKRNVMKSNSKNFLETLDLAEIEGLDVDQAYSRLHSLESEIDISETLKFNIKYFLVDVRTRIRLLRNMSLEMLE